LIRRHFSGKHLICDKGTQFCCRGFKRWCKRRGITPRFGTVGQHGSIAVLERFILTMKTLCTRVILVPTRCEKMRDELKHFQVWYNESRPHTTLGGRTPDEAYERRHPRCPYPRLEPRSRWPRESSGARPGVPICGKPGDRFTLHIEHHWGRKHLPLISLRRAA
jgi:putative transposase